MAELKITIPDDKENSVLAAFADARGIEATLEAVKKELTDEIKDIVKRYEIKQVAQAIANIELT